MRTTRSSPWTRPRSVISVAHRAGFDATMPVPGLRFGQLSASERMTQFTPEKREELRRSLVDAARTDNRISAAAHLGSMALGRLDRWSDIDLALACVNT